MDSKNKELMKKAEIAIETLQAELMEKTASLNTYEMAVKLAFDMFDEGRIAVEQIESKIDELKNESTEDLKILEKALELNKKASAVDRLSLSSRMDLDAMDPSDRFIQSLFN